MDQYPDKIFIVVTQPPLSPAETNLESAVQARRFADWLASDEFRAGRLNVFTFNFFDYLAEDDPESPELNMLRVEYRLGDDSHPNLEANQTIGPKFVEFVLNSITAYKTLSIPMQ